LIKGEIAMRMLLISLILLGGVTTGQRDALAQSTRPATRPLAPVMGTLASIDGNNLVIEVRLRGGEANDLTIPTDDNTQFLIDGDPGKLGDLMPGMQVSAASGPGTAKRPPRTMVVATSKGISGTITKVDGGKMTLHVVHPGGQAEDLTISTDDKTRVRFLGGMVNGTFAPGHDGKQEDLKAGMRVKVLAENGAAVKVFVSPSAPTAAHG
jgi:hypothetical protein